MYRTKVIKMFYPITWKFIPFEIAITWSIFCFLSRIMARLLKTHKMTRRNCLCKSGVNREEDCDIRIWWIHYCIYFVTFRHLPGIGLIKIMSVHVSPSTRVWAPWGPWAPCGSPYTSFYFLIMPIWMCCK